MILVFLPLAALAIALIGCELLLVLIASVVGVIGGVIGGTKDYKKLKKGVKNA